MPLASSRPSSASLTCRMMVTTTVTPTPLRVAPCSRQRTEVPAMHVCESWEDEHGTRYAIIWHPPQERVRFGIRPFEPMYLYDGELWSFGGSVGYRTADFDTLASARAFLLRGF